MQEELDDLMRQAAEVYKKGKERQKLPKTGNILYLKKLGTGELLIYSPKRSISDEFEKLIEKEGWKGSVFGK